MLEEKTGISNEEASLSNVINRLIEEGYEIKQVSNGSNIAGIKLDNSYITMSPEGTATITVTYDENSSGGNEYYAVVKNKYYKITMDSNQVKVARTESNLDGTATTDSIEAISSDNCVSVEIKGNQIILKSSDTTGTATITVTCGSYSQTCEVKVEGVYMNARMPQITKGMDYMEMYNIVSANPILQEIVQISFEESIPEDLTQLENYWDITSDKEGNKTNAGKAYAWITGEDNQKVLHYGQEGGIVLSKKGLTLPLCINATTITGLNKVDTSNVTDMSNMFSFCINLSTGIDLSNFNTDNVTDMSGMFNYCGTNVTIESLDLTKFNTKNVTDMSYMFRACSTTNLINLNYLNTNNVTNMQSMFSAVSQVSEIDLSNFNTSNVTNMKCMFEASNFVSIDISGWNTSNVTDMSYMFNYCQEVTDIKLGNGNTANVSNMERMFSACLKLTNLDLSGLNTSNVKNMSMMFSGCDDLETLNLSNFEVTNVTDCTEMFGSVGSGATYKIRVPITVEITTNSTMKTWLNTNFPTYTNIVEV